MDWPEHEKLEAIADKSQAIGEFLEWLESDFLHGGFGIRLCSVDPDNGRYGPVHVTGFNREGLLAAHFGIDLDTLEEEKREMLRQCRERATARSNTQ